MISRNPIAVHFGRNLHRARKRIGVSQEDLAVLASLHRTEIGLLERGERTPRVDTLIKLAAATDHTPAELLEGIAWTPGSTQVGEFRVGPRVATAREARKELEEHDERIDAQLPGEKR